MVDVPASTHVQTISDAEVPLKPSSKPIPLVVSSPLRSPFIKKRKLEDKKPSIEPVNNSLHDDILREQ